MSPELSPWASVRLAGPRRGRTAVESGGAHQLQVRKGTQDVKSETYVWRAELMV